MIQLTILGSGTGAPYLRRSAPGILVRLGDFDLLLDCGEGTIRKLLKAGSSSDQIDTIFLSHFHPDHSAGLIPFLFATKYNLGFRRNKVFSIFSHQLFSEFYRDLRNAFGQWVEPAPGLMEIELLKAGDIRSKILESEITFRFSSVAHNPESLAARIEFKGFSLVYSGDTDYSEDLVNLAKSVDLFICECSLPEHMKTEGHSTPSIAGKMASEAGCRTLLLTHMYPACDKADMTGPCRNFFKGELFIAEDSLRLEF